MPELVLAIEAVRAHADAAIARHAQGFFKTGPGDYGEGDVFLGVRMPVLRRIAKDHRDASSDTVLGLLKQEEHELRMLALLIWTLQYPKRDHAGRQKIYREYLAHTQYINNWDLVDCSAHKIVGPHLFNGGRDVLFKLAKSDLLWERRISIISTFFFIRQGDLETSYQLAERLLGDTHDLMHKAVGWVLRECGKQDRLRLLYFLQKYYTRLPRTTLRYAIERFPNARRKEMLGGDFSSAIGQAQN